MQLTGLANDRGGQEKGFARGGGISKYTIRLPDAGVPDPLPEHEKASGVCC